MSGEKYTQGQILCGLEIFWREELGCESAIEPDVRIDEQLKAEDVFDCTDVNDFIYRLERLFDFTCPRKEWESFFGMPVQDAEEWEKNVAPRLTFRALAEFIRERAEPIPLRPLVLLGKPCRTAGIFRGLEELVRRIRPKVRPFAPSTPIHTRLGKVERHILWTSLRWITEERIPPSSAIPIPDRHFLTRSFFYKLGIAILIAMWRHGLAGLLIGVIGGIFSTYLFFFLLAWALVFINYQINPIPKEIQTFGDLARYLAVITEEQQPQGASCSTP